MSRQLTTRQTKFIQAKLKGQSNAAAARIAGYSRSVANVAGRKILSHPAVRAKFQEVLARSGLNDENLSLTIQGRDMERTAQIGRLPPQFRRIIQSLVLALAAGQTDEALRSLRALEMNLRPPKRREITMEELWRRIGNLEENLKVQRE